MGGKKIGKSYCGSRRTKEEIAKPRPDDKEKETVLELESSLDAIRIVIPVRGRWSVINDYAIFFISREDMVVGVFVINIERV